MSKKIKMGSHNLSVFPKIVKSFTQNCGFVSRSLHTTAGKGNREYSLLSTKPVSSTEGSHLGAPCRNSARLQIVEKNFLTSSKISGKISPDFPNNE